MRQFATADRLRLWIPAVCWGLAAYLLHKVGAANGLYIAFGWFQNLTHAASASALAALVAVAGITLGYRRLPLLVFVVGATAAGALTWELVEYLGLLDAYGIWLHFHGVHDMLVDMAANAVGVTVTLAVLYHRTGFDLPHRGLTLARRRDADRF